MLRTNGRGYAGEVNIMPQGLKSTMTILVLLCLLTLSILSTGFIFAKQVVLVADGQKVELSTQADSVEKFLQEQQVTLGAYDKIRITDAEGKQSLVSKKQQITDCSQIEVLRSHQITLQVDGTTKTYQTVAATVGDFLAEAKITLDNDDYCQPQKDQVIDRALTVKVVRVEYVNEIRYKDLPYQIVEQESYDLPKGQTELAQPGFNGLEEQHWQQKYEDGVLISENMTSALVVNEPVDQIITVGKSEDSFVTINGVNYKYTSELDLRATAYTYTGFRTATGTNPCRGIIAVDTNVIPFGTKLYIEGYGVAIAADRGGAIKGNRVDLFMESYNEAIHWGIKNVKAYVLE